MIQMTESEYAALRDRADGADKLADALAASLSLIERGRESERTLKPWVRGDPYDPNANIDTDRDRFLRDHAAAIAVARPRLPRTPRPHTNAAPQPLAGAPNR